MTPEQFCYWLQGFAELGGERPSEVQWKSIIEHVGTVFKKVTPPLNVGPLYPPGVRDVPWSDKIQNPLRQEIIC